jgi:hypothetical protein
MTQKFNHELECSQFEALLAEAIDLGWNGLGTEGRGDGDGDGTVTLPADARQAFEAHGRSCPVCGPLWAETREGMQMLRQLEFVEPPKNMVHNILAATSMKAAGQEAAVLGRNDAPREKRGFLVSVRRSLSYAPLLLRSRFATSFIMAFFSLSVTLSLMGVRIGDVAKVDWHPNALRKSVVLQYTQVESKVQRYYDNMRLVYEVETRVRGLKKAVAPEQEEKKNDDKPERQNRNTLPDTSGNPRDNDTYSQERLSEPQLAQNRPAGDPAASLNAKFPVAKSAIARLKTSDEGAQI